MCRIPKKGENANLTYPCLFNCNREEGSLDTENGRCSDCNCDDEDILTHRCLGRSCGKLKINGVLSDVACKDGLTCDHGYCTDPSGNSCTNSDIPRCGRCGGTTCNKRTHCQYFQCRKAKPLDVFNEDVFGTCFDCECEPKHYKPSRGVKICPGIINKEYPERCLS
jgi:hypothetical protein